MSFGLVLALLRLLRGYDNMINAKFLAVTNRWPMLYGDIIHLVNALLFLEGVIGATLSGYIFALFPPPTLTRLILVSYYCSYKIMGIFRTLQQKQYKYT